MKPRLPDVLAALERLHGQPAKPLPRTPLEWVLRENVAYTWSTASAASAPSAR